MGTDQVNTCRDTKQTCLWLQDKACRSKKDDAFPVGIRNSRRRSGDY